jgi:hypothetical protein
MKEKVEVILDIIEKVIVYIQDNYRMEITERNINKQGELIPCQ